jgi:hypothetical protein
MSSPKVLVGVVTYSGKHYIFPKNYDAISNLSYPNYDFIIVDNTSHKSYTSKLRREGYKNVHWVGRGVIDKNSRMALTKSQNYIREKFINEGYDFLMLIESDLLPDRNIIQRLMSHAKPVVGSVYYLGTNKVKFPCIFLREGEGSKILGVTETFPGHKNVNMAEINAFLDGSLKKVHGCGFGCTLIRRDVVKKFPFWYDERFADKHSDVYFYMDTENNNIPVYVDTSVIVPHFPSDWNLVKDR